MFQTINETDISTVVDETELVGTTAIPADLVVANTASPQLLQSNSNDETDLIQNMSSLSGIYKTSTVLWKIEQHTNEGVLKVTINNREILFYADPMFTY